MTGNDKDRSPALLPDNDAAIADFLQKVAATPAPLSGGTGGRLIFALDATASRQPTWDQAMHLQSEMFDVTSGLGGLEVQLVFFRGYRECKASRWTRDGESLAEMMLKVRCLAGRTQIGKVLSHALKETEQRKVGALVYVGDAFEENLDDVAEAAGALGVHGTPAFLFHEGINPIAGMAFKQIAQLSGGAFCPFNAGSADRLRELLAAVAVYASGGLPALADLGRRRGGEALMLTRRMGGQS